MSISTFFPYSLAPWQWAAWIMLGLFIGLSKTGFSGLNSITIPIIAIIFGARESTGLVLPLLIFADILAVSYYRNHAEWKYIIRLVPWSLAGFGAAIMVDHLIPVQAFRYIMGASILTGLIVMIWMDYRGKSKSPPSGWWFSALFGIAGGFATTFGNAAGPIMAVFLLSMALPKNSFVGDLFIGHIGGMDSFAVGLEVAQRIIDSKLIPAFVKKRYSSFDSPNGQKFEKGSMKLEELAKIGMDAGYGKTGLTSGKQEYLENIFNQCLLGL